MPSGQHFIPGVPLTATTNLTPTDIDTSQSGVRLATGRSLIIVKETAPASGDGPDFQRLTWSAPTLNNLSRQFFYFDNTSWTPYTANVDLSDAIPNSLPVNALDITTGLLTYVATIVNTVDGPRAGWKAIPLPYNIGLDGTVLFSDGTNAAFRKIQGVDIYSDLASTNLYPLVSDGLGGSSFIALPPASIVKPTGMINILVSRASGPYASSILNLSELTSDTDLVHTHVTAGYIPVAGGDGTISWIIRDTSYETASITLLSAAGTITIGSFAALTVDIINWTIQKPVSFSVFIECQSIDQGYSVGDRINLDGILNSTGTRTATYKVSYSGLTATVKAIIYGKYAQAYSPSGVISTVLLDDSKWRFVVTTNKI